VKAEYNHTEQTKEKERNSTQYCPKNFVFGNTIYVDILRNHRERRERARWERYPLDSERLARLCQQQQSSFLLIQATPKYASYRLWRPCRRHWRGQWLNSSIDDVETDVGTRW